MDVTQFLEEFDQRGRAIKTLQKNVTELMEVNQSLREQNAALKNQLSTLGKTEVKEDSNDAKTNYKL